MFAQETIKAEVVAQELDAVHKALGASLDAKKFFAEALLIHGGTISEKKRFFVGYVGLKIGREKGISRLGEKNLITICSMRSGDHEKNKA